MPSAARMKGGRMSNTGGSAPSFLSGCLSGTLLSRLLVVLVLACLLLTGSMTLSSMTASDSAILGRSATVDYLQAQLKQREAQLNHVFSRKGLRSTDPATADNDSTADTDSAPLSSAVAGAPSDSGREAYLGFKRSSTSFSGTNFHSAMSAADDSLLEELVFRRNTRYWLESRGEWPDKPLPPRDKFVTFSPWRGGFNNIRMSLEMAVAFAAATNRTLVMPPEQNMYLRGKSSLASYFDYDDLARGISLVTYEEFFKLIDFGRYQKEKPGTLHSTVERYYTGLAEMPDGQVYNTKDVWSKDMIGGQVVFCFPNCPKSDAENKDHNSPEYRERKWFKAFSERLKPYDADTPAIANAKIVHFPENLLGHFYTMVYHRDVEQGRRIKRIVRDHVHFREEIFEYAERIINKLQDFQFSCLHIRRNEFQFKDAWTPAEDIVEHTKQLFKKGETIYISTDELSDEKETKRSWSDPKAMVTKAKHTWFTPMKKEWGEDRVVFLSDFFDELLGDKTPTIYIGCIESIVCSRARVFVGTRKSTFSGYIHRMRGYMHDVGQKLILDAQSRYPTDYYKFFKGPEWSQLQGAYEASHPYWGREYKDVWEGVFASPFAA